MRRASESNESAVVLGGSMAGLLAARVLSDAYRTVTIVERDELPETPAPRKGTPHAVHTHGLLARGCEALDLLFPGLTTSLHEQGAIVADLQQDIATMFERTHFKRRTFGSVGVLCSRLLLEAEVRRRVRALPNVHFLTGTDVLSPEYDPASGGVCGVRVRNVHRGEERALGADFVIDATGRGSQTPAWLRSWGYQAVEEERVTVGFRYATAYFERSSDIPTETSAGVLCTATADHPYPGVMLAQEPDASDAQSRPRWVVTVGAYQDDPLDVSFDGLRSRALLMNATDMIRITHEARPLSPVLRYGFKHSQRRRYERLQRFPANYLVMGDAITSFNPVYGQGMTVAACEALVLRRLLARPSRSLHRAFFKAASRIIDTPWQIAVGGDLAIPSVEGHRTAGVRFINRYLARVFRAAARDALVARAFVAVMHLLAPPTSLFRPRILARVLMKGGRTAPSTAPALSADARTEPAARTAW